MKKFVRAFFVNNWQRKLISFILAIIIWLLVNNSLITDKTYQNVPVRVTNVPKGMHIEGLRPDGFLEDRLTLKIVGHKKFLNDLSPNDIQVLLNAHDKNHHWVATVNKHQIVFLNKLVNPYPYIKSVNHEPFVVSMQNDKLKKP